MKRKAELKGLLKTGKSCVENDNVEGLINVINNIANIMAKNIIRGEEL